MLFFLLVLCSALKLKRFGVMRGERGKGKENVRVKFRIKTLLVAILLK
jgi:hypothetical protein